MKKKPDIKQHIQFDGQRRGCGLGCCSIGCLGIFGLFIVIIVGGYFSLFHSSLPLRLIEAAIEEDGEVEIEGLEGSLATGFKAEELRFKTMDDQWSELKDIKFQYDMNGSMFGSDSIIIKEVSVASGTIYADWNPDENEFDFDPDIGEEVNEELEDFNEEFEEFDEEMREEIGHAPGLKEVRIDLVSIQDLRIINPATELEFTVDEVKFEGFHWEEGDLKSLGTLVVHSTQLDLETVPTVEFTDIDNAQRFEGTMHTEADHRLKTDVPFSIDFGVSNDLEVSLKAELFDARLKFSESPESSELVYDDFSPADYIEFEDGTILPSNIQMIVQFDKEKSSGPSHVHESGSFKLGQTKFSNPVIDQTEDGKKSVVMATGMVGGRKVTAVLNIEGPNSPWWKTGLISEQFDSQQELWAQTLFGKSFDELSSEEQTALAATRPRPRSRKTPVETVDDVPAEADIKAEAEESLEDVTAEKVSAEDESPEEAKAEEVTAEKETVDEAGSDKDSASDKDSVSDKEAGLGNESASINCH